MYKEYAIFEKNKSYIILFPQIHFWLKTNKHGLLVFSNLLKNRIGENEIKMKKMIEDGALDIEYSQDIGIDLIEIEFGTNFHEEQINVFLQINNELWNKNISKGLIIKKQAFLTNLEESKLLRLRFNYIEIDCNHDTIEEILLKADVFDEIKTVHLKNIILNTDVIEQLAELKRRKKLEVIIHVRNNKYMYDYIKVCAYNSWYFTVEIESFESSYYDLYTSLVDYIKLLDWNIDYKKYCSLFSYEKVIKERLVRKSCGLVRDKIYICEDGKIYSCQDCAQRKCFAIATVFDDDFLQKWKCGPVCEKIRKLTVESIKECSDCCFRYICGGQCRMKSFDKYKSFDRKSAYCEDEKKIYVELLWECFE